VNGLYAAFDLGAGSGRTFIGGISGERAMLEETHRFTYAPRPVDGRLRWNIGQLRDGLADGLCRAVAAAAARGAGIESVGVDAWGVDYGLIDADGRLVEEPICYRDSRTDGVMEQVEARIPRDELFARTGVQFLKLNTIYQLYAHMRDGLPRGAARLLMIPDLCHHVLCGSVAGERTNASTTQLLDPRTGEWDDELFSRLGLPRAIMPDLVSPGTELGRLHVRHQSTSGAGALPIVAPATHDTASAVAGTPLAPDWAFLSSGTWSLMGVEIEKPLTGPEMARANVTNELGVVGTVRFLKNIMGLWLLESCRREWEAARESIPLDALIRAASRERGFPGFVFPDAPRFFNPVSMIGELRASLAETRQPVRDDPVTLAKVILDSLALRYASVLDTLERLIGRPILGVHIVGGGCLNAYLNQATANATRRPVLAGPVEAAAAGNVIVQALAHGDVPSLTDARACLGAALSPRRFEPRDQPAWADAARRYGEIEAGTIKPTGS
jgi:rhamnulokinase